MVPLPIVVMESIDTLPEIVHEGNTDTKSCIITSCPIVELVPM